MRNIAFRAGAADMFAPGGLQKADRNQAGPYQIGARADLLQLELVSDRGGFDALGPEWDSLFDRAGRSHQAFQQFGWLWHWCNHFGPCRAGRGMRFAVVTGRMGGRLVMVLPLVVERVLGLRQLAWMGDPVSQYGDVLVEPEFVGDADLRRALEFAVSATRADLILLRKVRADAAIAPVLSTMRTNIVGSEEAPFIDLAATPSKDVFDERQPQKSRRNRRRQMRRLEERGNVQLEELRPGVACQALTRIALAFKRAWLRRKGGFSRSIGDPKFDAFFADAASGVGPDTGLTASALRCAGEVTAINIALACKGRQLLHVVVYNSKFEKTAAGILHIEAAIHQALSRGETVFDFLAPRHDYKMAWASGTVAVNDHALGCNAAGRAWAHAYWTIVRPLAKLVIERLKSRRGSPKAVKKPAHEDGAAPQKP